jgi:hypothetical protein
MDLTQKLFVSNSGTKKDPEFFYLPVSDSGTKMYLTLMDPAFFYLLISHRRTKIYLTLIYLALNSYPYHTKTTYNLVSSGRP